MFPPSDIPALHKIERGLGRPHCGVAGYPRSHLEANYRTRISKQDHITGAQNRDDHSFRVSFAWSY
jgi:hypothetical protein